MIGGSPSQSAHHILKAAANRFCSYQSSIFISKSLIPRINHHPETEQQNLGLGREPIYVYVPMDPFRGQGGIQMLLTAEQDAQHVVSTARNMKSARLKQAKEEAEREVAHYRSQLETEYQKKVSETSSESYTQRLQEETETKINNLKESSTRVSKDVADMLLKYVASVRT